MSSRPTPTRHSGPHPSFRRRPESTPTPESGQTPSAPQHVIPSAARNLKPHLGFQLPLSKHRQRRRPPAPYQLHRRRYPFNQIRSQQTRRQIPVPLSSQHPRHPMHITPPPAPHHDVGKALRQKPRDNPRQSVPRPPRRQSRKSQRTNHSRLIRSSDNRISPLEHDGRPPLLGLFRCNPHPRRLHFLHGNPTQPSHLPRMRSQDNRPRHTRPPLRHLGQNRQRVRIKYGRCVCRNSPDELPQKLGTSSIQPNARPDYHPIRGP